MRISSIGKNDIEKKIPKTFEVKPSVDQKDTSNEEAKQNSITNVSKKNQTYFTNDSHNNKPSITSLEKPLKSVKTISISEALNNESKSIEEEEISCKRNSDFSESEMHDAWNQMVDFVKEKGKVNLSIILSAFLPVLKSNFVIEFSLSNTSQLEIFIEEKYMLLDFLKDKLSNDLIDIVTVIVEIEKKDIVYTNKDKFKKMLEKNSSLVTLQKKIGLDPDY